MHRLRVQGDEVPESVMRGLRLRDLAVGMRLGGMDEIRKLDAVLDKENGHVVAHQVHVAFVGVRRHGEATDIADGVR